jgi:hypothetical protein
MLPCVHPFSGWQLSFVHGFRSSQSSALPAEQTPVLHTSVPLQTSVSAHVVPSGCDPFGGHVGDEPVHDSFASQSFTAGLQTVPALPAGCPQAPFPSHWSRVQTFPSSVHPVPDGLAASVGQSVALPLQLSARSHSPVAALQTVPALPAGCVHVTAVPLQISAVQGSASAVHAEPFVFRTSAGQALELPLQVSTRSHSPAAGRHALPAPPAGC